MGNRKELLGIALATAEVLSEGVALSSTGWLIAAAGAVMANHGDAAVTCVATAAACMVFSGTVNLITKVWKGRQQ